MQRFRLVRPRGRPLRVLCLGAHGDDLEIGCGGTILRLVRELRDAEFHWIVFSGDAVRRREARASARAFLAGAATSAIRVHGFRDGYFPWEGATIKDVFEALKRRVDPDLVLTHHRGDAHQDHRVVSELAWNTFRDHCILEYEVPKYDGDLATPNVYVPLTSAVAERKIALLVEHYPSQRTRRWFDAETFRGLMRVRGVESNAPAGLAEGFHGRKLVL